MVTQKIHSQINLIKKSQQPILVNFGIQTAKRALFRDNNINYIEVEKFDINIVPDTLFRSEVVYKAAKQ